LEEHSGQTTPFFFSFGYLASPTEIKLHECGARARKDGVHERGKKVISARARKESINKLHNKLNSITFLSQYDGIKQQ